MIKESKFWIVLTLILAAATVTAACGTPQNTAGKKVTAAQVKAFQDQKTQKRVDIYIPIKEQYATSKHNESLKDLRSEPEEIEPKCFRCHSAEGFLAKPADLAKMKDVKYPLTCTVCHVMTINEFKLRLPPLETCTECHTNEGKIIAGKELHHTQKEMFLGYGALGVPSTPSAEYIAGLTCIECHMPNEAHSFQGKTPAEAIAEHSESICVMCHSDKQEAEFAKEVQTIQNQIKAGINRLDQGLSKADKRIKVLKSQGRDVTVAKQVYDLVYTNMTFIEADRSLGIHNFEYAKKILSYSLDRQAELDRLVQ